MTSIEGSPQRADVGGVVLFASIISAHALHGSDAMDLRAFTSS
ncbi:hypothetical protein VR010_00075 [Actinomycetaceae bacterium L2_0104]